MLQEGGDNHDIYEKNVEKLVMLSDSQELVCFRDIHRAFPTLANEDLYSLIGDSFVPEDLTFTDLEENLLNENPLFYWVQRPTNYKPGYVFKPDDCFKLSISASDIRYELEKEFMQKCLGIATFVCSLLSLAFTIYSSMNPM